jgi:hypothetical protein
MKPNAHPRGCLAALFSIGQEPDRSVDRLEQENSAV